MKKLIILASTFIFLAMPSLALANDSKEVVCPQPYGGGVVCGIHTPVNTGIGDNMGLIGAGFILASGALFYFSRKFRFAN